MPREREHDQDYDLLNQYLQEIARVPRLTPERERELGKRVQENPNDKEAIEELVKANLRFVVSYAKRYRNTHVHFLDLINEGNIGLMHAAKKYDPEKNVKFITYAVWWIRQAILHALSEQGGAFRQPPKRANLMYRHE
jgi:RNA polymerase primary sigma factor